MTEKSKNVKKPHIYMLMFCFLFCFCFFLRKIEPQRNNLRGGEDRGEEAGHTSDHNRSPTFPCDVTHLPELRN